MAVAEPMSERARLHRKAIDGGEPATGGRGHPGRWTPTLGDVIEAIARETKSELELVAAVVHLFDTRTVRWARSPGAGADVRPAPCNPDGSVMAFD